MDEWSTKQRKIKIIKGGIYQIMDRNMYGKIDY